MTISYEALDKSIEHRAACEGISVELAAIRTFALMAMAVAVDIPVSLRPALVAGLNRWFVGVEDGESLMPYRIAAWEYLETKNGSSITIADGVDRAIRVLIFVLRDEPLDIGELGDGLDFFIPLINGYGGLERVLGMQDE